MIKSIYNISVITVIIFAYILLPFTSNAQSSKSAKQLNQITLKVSADGATKEEAINNALRSAVEQACGAFVSSNTTIFNDELVKDEVVMLSSGNVKKYSEISSVTLPNSRQYVLIEATVSLPGIAKYVESKGVTASFSGNSFAATMKLRELNSQAEAKIARNLILQIKDLAPSMYDLELEVSEPKVSETGYIIPMKVSYVRNANTEHIFQFIFTTLSSLSLTESEMVDYKVNGIAVYQYRFGVCKIGNYFTGEGDGFTANNMYSEMHNAGDIAEITIKSSGLFSRGDTRMATSEMKLGELYKNLNLHYWKRSSGDATYSYMMRCAFRSTPDWLSSLAKIIVAENSDFIITDNLGNEMTIDSPGIKLNENNYYKSSIPSLVPVHLDFYVNKDDISKYSSFTVSHYY